MSIFAKHDLDPPLTLSIAYLFRKVNVLLDLLDKLAVHRVHLP